MAKYKTPGVYVTEQDSLPNSVVEVATAVPAFIGYTEIAKNGSKSLLNKPFRISSYAEYKQYFGGGPDYLFELKAMGGAGNNKTVNAAKNLANISMQGIGYAINRTGTVYRLFDAIRLFYQNGGGSCYIVSVGDYSNGIKRELLDGTHDINPGGGLKILEKEQEPTMILCPDALSLDKDNCYTFYQQVLLQCEKMKSRVGIFDVYQGFKDRNHPDGDVIEFFREGIGMNGLTYGAAYYPWVNTTIITETEVSFSNLTDDSLGVLKQLITDELGLNAPDPGEKTKEIIDFLENLGDYTIENVKNWKEDDTNKEKMLPKKYNSALVSLSPAFNSLLRHMVEILNELPPASAMAGIYTLVDTTRGVWKAPANISMNSVVKPTVNITSEEQQDLNMPLNGKAINAIRSFIGEGVMVWGAHTLDGNNQDWRYINVRRTVIMLEQSIKAAAKAYVFEPNDANTWTTVKSMIENFLYGQWKSGGLVGSSPEDAYAVHIGLGQTMTGDDILNGIMRVTVHIAVSRPAEFIVITFQQQMQTT